MTFSLLTYDGHNSLWRGMECNVCTKEYEISTEHFFLYLVEAGRELCFLAKVAQVL